MRILRTPALWLAGAMFVAGCAGRGAVPAVPVLPSNALTAGSAMPANGPAGRTRGDVTATIEIPPSGGADFTAAFPGFEPAPGVRSFHRPMAGSGKQILIQGVLYPSYAATNTPRNGIVVPLKAHGAIKVTMSFSNSVVANNEWAIFNLFLIGKDGSYLYIGSEAAVFNVNQAKPIKVTVDPATTQIYQATLALVQAGLVTAADLAALPKLPSQIGNEIAHDHLKPDPGTGLFSVNSIDQFVKDEIPTWQRVMTIDGGPTAREIAVANDVGNAPANALSLNLRTALGIAVDSSLRPPGSACGQAVPAHLPGTHPTPAPQVCAAIFGTFSGKITIPVSGNSILVGASNGRSPYTGTFQIADKRGPANKSTVKLGSLKPTELTVKTKDAFDWAFGTPPGVEITTGTTPGSQPYAVVANFYTGFNYSLRHPFEFVIPTNYSAAHATIAVNKWSPFGLSSQVALFCTTWGVCQPATSKATFDVQPPFADPGTKLSYFKWRGQSGSKIGTVNGCTGYTMTPRRGKIVIATSTPTLLMQSQQLQFGFGQSVGCGSFLPAGATVQVVAVDKSGITYEGQRVQQPPLRQLGVTMDTYLPLTPIQKLTITIVLPKGVSTQINLVTISSQFTP